MHPRLNVTEAERLCYSRRRLQAISALRTAGIDPTIFGLHKDYRVPGVRGKVYFVRHPTGTTYAFRTLDELHVYAAQYREWKTAGHFAWQQWRKVSATAPPQPPERLRCRWADCQYAADSILEGQPYCRAHTLIYEEMLVASSKRASPVSSAHS